MNASSDKPWCQSLNRMECNAQWNSQQFCKCAFWWLWAFDFECSLMTLTMRQLLWHCIEQESIDSFCSFSAKTSGDECIQFWSRLESHVCWMTKVHTDNLTVIQWEQCVTHKRECQIVLHSSPLIDWCVNEVTAFVKQMKMWHSRTNLVCNEIVMRTTSQTLIPH